MSWATTVQDRRVVAVVLALAGCDREDSGRALGVCRSGSVGGDADVSSSTDAGGPAPMDGGTPADTDGPTPPKPGSHDEGDAGTSDGSSTSDGDSAGEGSSGELPPPVDEPDSAGADPGVRPGSGPWSSCADGVCAPGLGCLQGETTGATCTTACVGFDPDSCPPPPGEVATTDLHRGRGPGRSRDCAGGRTCPSGMQCVLDQDDAGAIAVCL
ncbi:MAG: hypothetical protein U0168_29770 [Nannocystaceae bacterium]